MQTVLVDSTAEWVRGEPGSKGRKTPSVFPAGMLMAGLIRGILTHGLVYFLEGHVLLGSFLFRLSR